jgi:hypothetical protein
MQALRRLCALSAPVVLVVAVWLAASPPATSTVAPAAAVGVSDRVASGVSR